MQIKNPEINRNTDETRTLIEWRRTRAQTAKTDSRKDKMPERRSDAEGRATNVNIQLQHSDEVRTDRTGTHETDGN